MIRENNIRCKVNVEGCSASKVGLSNAQIRQAAGYFAICSSHRCGERFSKVTIILQKDIESDVVHRAIMGVDGATDVITQRYDAMPGENEGVYGELYVNVEQALRAAPRRRNWCAASELLLYIAHGMDHLSNADDHGEKNFIRMRRRELKWIRAYLKR